MKVAVTGGAGYIGSTLVKELAEGGDQVASVDNLMNGDYGHLGSLGVGERAELHVADIRDGKKIKGLFSGSDAIAHLAALPGLVKCREMPEEATSINVYGTHQVLEAARSLDIGKVVFCSSAAVYGNPAELPVIESHPLRPLNLYGVTKLAGEKLMESYFDNYGIETIILRFGNVFGVGLYTNYDTVIPKFVRMGLAGEPLTVYGDGTSSRDFVHVEDIVQSVKLSLVSEGRGGEVYNVGGETLEIGSLAESVAEYLEKETGEGVGVTHLPPRQGETKELSYDLAKISRDLGYEPRWSVMRGVEQIAKFRLEQLASKA
jgi:UDP-glucose 4-epimerase